MDKLEEKMMARQRKEKRVKEDNYICEKNRLEEKKIMRYKNAKSKETRKNGRKEENEV